MSKVEELTKRYTTLKDEYKNIESEIIQDEARLELKKEEFQKLQKELEEKGIKFKGLKELREIKGTLEKRIEEQVERMEELMGIGEEDDEYEFDL